MSSFKGKPAPKGWTVAQEALIAPMGYYIEVRGTKAQLTDLDVLLDGHVIYIGRGQSQHRSVRDHESYGTTWRSLDPEITPTKATLFHMECFDPEDRAIRLLYFKTYLDLCYYFESLNFPFNIPQPSIDLTPEQPRLLTEPFI